MKHPAIGMIETNSIARGIVVHDVMLKKAHVDVIPGLRGYLREFTSERAWGEEGYLSDRGLIPMPDEERSKVAADVRNLTPLSLAAE